MKGTPMKRNFGIGGSPTRKNGDKLDVTDVENLEGEGIAGGEEHFVHLEAADKATKLRDEVTKSGKGSNQLDVLSKRLGGTWTKNKNGKFLNQDGMTVSQVETENANAKAKALKA